MIITDHMARPVIVIGGLFTQCGTNLSFITKLVCVLYLKPGKGSNASYETVKFRKVNA